MIQIYYGNGKGKTTCAIGAAVRASGAGLKVLIVQFFKSSKSCERTILKDLQKIELYPCPDKVKFTFYMNDTELQEEGKRYASILKEIIARQSEFDVIILDEFFTLLDSGLFTADRLSDFLSSIYKEKELILTGHAVAEEFIGLADYATEFKCIRHPYSKGVKARVGIEF